MSALPGEIQDREFEEQLQRRNRTWLIVLVAVIIVAMFSSYFLFNNYWDPNVSDTTFSH